MNAQLSAIRSQFDISPFVAGQATVTLADQPVATLHRWPDGITVRMDGKIVGARTKVSLALDTVAVCLDLHTDPRTPAEQAQDEFTAEVLATQASDRPY